MKKLILVGIILSCLWVVFSLDTYANSLSEDISGEDSNFVIGYILGMFTVTFSPLGAVLAYQGYQNKYLKNKEIIN